MLACVLAGLCVSAYSQDKSDLFGQVPAAAAEPSPAQSAPRRVNITNDSYAERDAERGADRDMERDGRRERSAERPESFSTDILDVDFGEPGKAEEPASKGAPVRRARTRPVATDFQKFIFDNTGRKLPIFGADFFANAPSTFAPIGNAPVPAEYSLAAGDELLIRGWGSIDINYRAKIDRNGLISIPTVGSVVLAGVKAGDAEAVVRAAIARLYKGVTVSVNFGQLRAITVYVVGQARRPGTYTVSSLSTLVTAVFASGGPNANGSMRHIQVRRGNVVAAELDLYAFIAKGNKSGDIKLRDGDTIVIPAASGHVAVMGKVNSPGIYELSGAQDRIDSLLDFAGGMPVVADPRRAFLERIDVNRNQPRSVEQFALNSEGLKRTLKNGDVLNITSITPEFSNAVILRGNVDQPLRVPFRAGMRISDLIPSRDHLVTRKAVKRQNNAVNNMEDAAGTREGDIAGSIGTAVDEINWEYAVVERVNRADLAVSIIPFNLGKVFTNPDGADNVQLQAGDTVTVFSQQDVAVPLSRRRIFVRVEGEVAVPGVYQMSAGETLQTLLARAGGPTSNAYIFGSAFYRENVRKEQELNLEKAAVRLEAQARSAQSKELANLRGLAPEEAQAAANSRMAEIALGKEAIARFRQLKPTGRIAFGLPTDAQSFARLPQLKLENGDRLVIPSRPDFVHVFGSVNAEASPLWRPNSRVSDYLKTVGVMSDGDLENVFVIRVDGTVVSRDMGLWSFGGIGGLLVMPGDSIVVPEKFDKETKWTKFTKGTREWAQIFASFGLGAAAVKTLRD